MQGLKVSKIDPKVETQNYVDKILKTKGAKLTQDEKDLMVEDLRSPCTEEVAVFHAYHRQAIRYLKKAGITKVMTPLMRLQDPNYTKIILVAEFPIWVPGDFLNGDRPISLLAS